MAASSKTSTIAENFSLLHEEIVGDVTDKTKLYTRKNIEKALSVTGYKDTETVLKWLKNHSKDPLLNEEVEREFILFLCPTGPLLNEISKFYEQSYNKCGSNSAHNLFPHITLSSFFKVNNEFLPTVFDRLNECLHSAKYSQPEKLKLILQRSEGYIGLFLNESTSSWVADLTAKFAGVVNADVGVSIKPHERKFHLTLAYNFEPSQTEDLENLAKKINVEAAARWEFNVYSRDPSFNGKQIHLITRDYKATNPAELDLHCNSHVIMDSETSKKNGWKRGTDYDTGKTGFFPDTFTKKTAEWRIWTKNFSFPVFRAQSDTDNDSKHKRSQSFNKKKDRKEDLRQSLRHPSRNASSATNASWQTNVQNAEVPRSVNVNFEVVNGVNGHDAHHRQLNSIKIKGTQTHLKPSDNVGQSSPLVCRSNTSQNDDRTTLRSSSTRRDRENTVQILQQRTSHLSVSAPTASQVNRVFAMRHAERVDLTFGHDWFQIYVDDRGYHRRNLNLPRRIPTRRNGPRDFFMDGPITEIGTFQAKLAGEALRANGLSFNAVFSSPSLRSIQTAEAVLDGLLDTNTKIKIEPALFEWMAWCRNTFPKFMKIDELVGYGIKVDQNYSPFYPLAQFNANEKTDEYYFRSHSFMQFATRNFPGNILVVGHSATLDVCTRQITGNPIRKTDDLIRVVQKVPYCGLCMIEEQKNKWSLTQPPIPSLAHGQNQSFDWREMESNPTSNGRV